MLENEAFVLSDLNLFEESNGEKENYSPSGSMKMPLLKIRNGRNRNLICDSSTIEQKSIAESVEKNLCRRVRLGQVSCYFLCVCATSLLPCCLSKWNVQTFSFSLLFFFFSYCLPFFKSILLFSFLRPLFSCQFRFPVLYSFFILFLSQVIYFKDL